ncbi:MAG: flagellar hook-associated protein FlgK, partial [Lachnospiraceae bacterium]|nr:flagellar hook-associated protein FlgK [Lachnospiraceae bacterium]
RQYNTISINGSAVAPQQVGLGVIYSETKTQRDYFLDKAFRKESGRSAFYETSNATLAEVENLLQELEGEDFATALKNLWTSVQDLANVPEQASNQSVFVQRAYEFLTRADAVYKGLADYQDNMNASIKGDVERINGIGNEIRELNEAILRVESGKVERANDLRDRREYLLDELGTLANISYDYDIFGNVNVKIEGNDFIKPDMVNEMAIYTDPTTGFHTPYWKQLATTYIDAFGEEQINIEGATVFNLDKIISSEMNTDIGSLKSTLINRGDHRANYEDLQAKPNDPDYYDREISQSVIMNMQAEFDQLVNKVAEGINQILTDAANAAQASDPDYMRDSYGNPLQLFNKISPSGSYSVSNMTINDELRQAPTLLGFIRSDGQVDRETTTKLKELFDKREYTLNPNVATKVNLSGYYNSMVSQVANTGSVFREICANQEMTVNGLNGAREQVVGVASDEEMGNMIMFQNAYNASSRYINVISEMLEHLLTTLGR